MYDRTKWNSWNDLGKMNKDEAIMRYVNELEKVAPSWKEQSGVLMSNDSDDESGGGGGGADGAMIMPQSRPVGEAEVAISELSADEKQIWFYAGQNNVKAIKEWIAKGVSVNAKDEEGRTSVDRESDCRVLLSLSRCSFVLHSRCSLLLSPLHWAVDRAYADLVVTLLTDLHADVNARDNEGSTALHYAAMCEHTPIILALLQHRADPFLKDEAGEAPAETIREIKGVTKEILDLIDVSKSKEKSS